MIIDRRRFVAASAGMSAALFGLTGLGQWGRAAMAEDGARVFHAAWPYLDPPQGHFNSFVTNGIMNPPNIYGDMIWQPFALFNWGSKEWMPLMATSWGFVSSSTPDQMAPDTADVAEIAPTFEGADTFQIRLREDCVWDDGSPFTAEDIQVTFTLKKLMSDIVWRYLDAVMVVDDYTVNFVMSEPSAIVQRYILRTSTQPAAIYGEWADQAVELFEAGKTMEDPDALQLLQKFSEFRPEQVISNGPFTVDPASVTNAQMTLVKNETAWNANQVLFDRIENFNGRGETIISIILEKSVDYGTQAFPPAAESQMLKDGFRIVRPPIYSGPGLIFNFGRHPELLDKRVRQALAHAIDRDQNGFVSMAESGVAPVYMAGMSDNLVTTWMEEDEIAGLNQYEFDLDKAAGLLEEAGWTRDGDWWSTPDGERASYELVWPAEYPDWSAAGQNATEQLAAFGFDISPVSVTAEQQPIDVDKGEFDIAVRSWGNSNNPHPHFSYTQAFFTHNTLAINNGGKGTQFPLIQETEVEGQVDLEALTIDSAEGLDIDAQRDQIARIAMVYNELLPVIPLWERYGNNSILENLRTGPWPADDDPVYQNSPYADGIVTMLMLQGRIGPAK